MIHSEEVIPFRYDNADHPSEGRATVLSGGKWGFIDTKGGWIASSQFEWAGDFHDGMARVQMASNGPYGYIDKEGNLAVQPQFRGERISVTAWRSLAPLRTARPCWTAQG